MPGSASTQKHAANSARMSLSSVVAPKSHHTNHSNGSFKPMAPPHHFSAFSVDKPTNSQQKLSQLIQEEEEYDEDAKLSGPRTRKLSIEESKSPADKVSPPQFTSFSLKKRIQKMSPTAMVPIIQPSQRSTEPDPITDRTDRGADRYLENKITDGSTQPEILLTFSMIEGGSEAVVKAPSTAEKLE